MKKNNLKDRSSNVNFLNILKNITKCFSKVLQQNVMRSCENCIFLLESKIHKIKNIEYLLIGCL